MAEQAGHCHESNRVGANPGVLPPAGYAREMPTENESVEARIDRLEIPFNSRGVDLYGTSKKHLAVWYKLLGFVYRNYLSVKAHGIENIPKRGRAMLIGNHSGGVALDGAMVIASCFFELDPPRLAHGMAEKFINQLPFASEWTARTGQLTGLPENASRLLEDDRLLMVFPEGAKGTAKLFKERYSLVDFGTGFMRLALKTRTPIIPLGFIGGADAIPTIANSYVLGKLIGAPYVPITPWLLALPRPARCELHYGAPLIFSGTGSEEDEVIVRYVDEVKARIAELIERARESRHQRGPLGALAGGSR
jgi:1-acyl-sn-glycerol-3-phosphate acyltransferase